MLLLLTMTTYSWNGSTVITPMTGTDKRRHHHQRVTEICPSRRVGHFKAPC